MSTDGERLRGIRDDVLRIEGGDIRQEARGGLADGPGLRRRIVRRRAVEDQRLKELEAEIAAGMYGPQRGTKECADYAAQVGQDMFRAGLQECLKLAKIYVKSEQDRVFDETAQVYDEIDWTKFEEQLERL